MARPVMIGAPLARLEWGDQDTTGVGTGTDGRGEVDRRRDSTDSRLEREDSRQHLSFSDRFPRTTARKSRSEGEESMGRLTGSRRRSGNWLGGEGGHRSWRGQRRKVLSERAREVEFSDSYL